MVEVFKTDVHDLQQANILVEQIHKYFSEYSANFDLEDCDKILRVECTTGLIQASCVIDLLQEFGCKAEVLPDDPQPVADALLDKALVF
jgi:hypothetical protein